jgi:hypothetical protein
MAIAQCRALRQRMISAKETKYEMHFFMPFTYTRPISSLILQWRMKVNQVPGPVAKQGKVISIF